MPEERETDPRGSELARLRDLLQGEKAMVAAFERAGLQMERERDEARALVDLGVSLLLAAAAPAAAAALARRRTWLAEEQQRG